MKEIVREVFGELKQQFVFNLRNGSMKVARQIFYRSFLQNILAGKAGAYQSASHYRTHSNGLKVNGSDKHSSLL
jgi:hypothetical protein